MPPNRHSATAVTEPHVLAADGLVLAPIPERGPWAALGALRSAMRSLRRFGLTPHVSYVYALSREGRIVPARGSDAVVIVMAYRLGLSA
jgi:hypothetical protein